MTLRILVHSLGLAVMALFAAYAAVDAQTLTCSGECPPGWDIDEIGKGLGK